MNGPCEQKYLIIFNNFCNECKGKKKITKMFIKREFLSIEGSLANRHLLHLKESKQPLAQNYFFLTDTVYLHANDRL